MSRFGNLEFNSEFSGQAPAARVLKDEQYYLTEARAAFAEADFDQAFRVYSKVLEFNPENVSAWAGQVRALIELNELGEAKLWADKALERFPREPELLATKAVVLGRTGDFNAALAFSDASIAERGDTPYVWLARGDVLLSRREKRADFCFEKALLLAPRDWLIAWLVARIRYFHRQFSLALHEVTKALEWNPAAAALWLLLGESQREVGLVSAARTSLRQARELNPQSALVGVALASLNRTGGWFDPVRWWRRLFHR
jgi:tetratricopeptide (TPR) repeat protein